MDAMDRRASGAGMRHSSYARSRAGSMARSGSAAYLSTSYHRSRTASGLPHGLIESVTLKLAAESKETQLSPEVKKKALVACLVALTVGNMMIENMAGNPNFHKAAGQNAQIFL